MRCRRALKRCGARRSGVAWFGVLVAAVVSIYGIGIALGLYGQDLTVNALACTIVFFGFLPLVVDQARPPSQRHLLITLTSGAWVLYFAVPVWTIYFANGSRIEMLDVMTLLAPEMVETLSVLLAAQVIFLASYALPLGRILGSIFPRVKHDWDPDVALALGVLMVPLGLAVWLGSAVGIIPRNFGSGALGAVAAGSWYGIALLTIVYLRFKKRAALILVFILIPVVMAIYFFSGMKEKFFLAPIFAVIALIVTTRRINAKWIVVGFFAFVLFYPVAQSLRDTRRHSLAEIFTSPAAALNDLSNIEFTTDVSDYFSDGIAMTTLRLSALHMTAVVIHDTPDRVPFQGGWTLSYIPITFIPRILWPGKPVFNVGQWVTDNYGAGQDIQSSTGVSWVGDFYMNFGIPGVIIGMIGMGLYFRVIHEIVFSGNTIPMLLAASIFAYNFPRSVENFVLSPVAGLVVNALPVIFVHFLVRNLGRNASVATDPGAEFGGEKHARIEV